MFIDWLSLYASMPRAILVEGYSSDYRVQEMQTGTPLFEKSYRVSLSDGRPIAFVAAIPRHPYMTPETVSVKFDNALLYSSDFFDQLINFLGKFGVRNTHITRLDLAVDCQQIAYGISAKEFAERLADSRFVKAGTRQLAIHKRSNFYVNPKADDGKHELISDGLPAINAVTFGTHNSICQSQVYNKTLELKSNLDANGNPKKAYIMDAWKDAGLDITQDVWRIELRLGSKADTLEYVGEGGEICYRRITLSDLDPDRGLKDTIRYAFKRWFCVYSLIGRDLKKTKHLTREDAVQVLSEEADLQFVAHAAQSTAMSKYVKGVLKFVTDLFTKAVPILRNHPEDGILQGYAIGCFLEKLYKVSVQLDKVILDGTARGHRVVSDGLHEVLSHELSKILGQNLELRRLLTVDDKTPVLVTADGRTSTMSQEDFYWISHFNKDVVVHNV